MKVFLFLLLTRGEYGDEVHQARMQKSLAVYSICFLVYQRLQNTCSTSASNFGIFLYPFDWRCKFNIVDCGIVFSLYAISVSENNCFIYPFRIVNSQTANLNVAVYKIVVTLFRGFSHWSFGRATISSNFVSKRSRQKTF